MRAAFVAGILVFAACALGACGGEDKGRPEPGSACQPVLLSGLDDTFGGAVDCNALAGYEVYWLDDFEGGAATGWYVNNDRTAAQVPEPDSDPVPGEAIPGGRCIGEQGPESRFAVHIRSGVLQDFGGVFGRNLRRAVDLPLEQCPVKPCLNREPPPPPMGPCGVGQGTPGQEATSTDRCIVGVDVSAYEGVVFWGRRGPGSSASVRVHVSDHHTDDSNQACECNPFTSQNDTSDGCDKFGAYVTLDDTFRAYFVPFAEMQQGGWGKKSLGLDTSSLFSIAIDYGRGPWDIWIDDIGFYRRLP